MSTIPSVSFDDFYKFMISISVFIILGLFAFISYLSIQNLYALKLFIFNWEAWIIFLLISIGPTYLIIYAVNKWKTNQHLIDEEHKIKIELVKQELVKKKTPQQEIISKQKSIPKKDQKEFAIVEYRVDSILPNTVSFDLLKDKKVWFWIANLEAKKYLAYVKIKLKISNKEISINEGYYGGEKPWNLNAYTGIHAPGMPISKYVEKIKKEKNLSIIINCEIKDESNKLIEKKLPVTYKYDFKNNSWYLEP